MHVVLRNIGGKEVLIAGMPDRFQKIFDILKNNIMEDKISRFNSADDAINSLKISKQN